jgi:hypothetical protein
MTYTVTWGYRGQMRYTFESVFQALEWADTLKRNGAQNVDVVGVKRLEIGAGQLCVGRGGLS